MHNERSHQNELINSGAAQSIQLQERAYKYQLAAASSGSEGRDSDGAPTTGGYDMFCMENDRNAPCAMPPNPTNGKIIMSPNEVGAVWVQMKSGSG